jgi:hypothetical protein
MDFEDSLIADWFQASSEKFSETHEALLLILCYLSFNPYDRRHKIFAVGRLWYMRIIMPSECNSDRGLTGSAQTSFF